MVKAMVLVLGTSFNLVMRLFIMNKWMVIHNSGNYQIYQTNVRKILIIYYFKLTRKAVEKRHLNFHQKR